VTSSENQDFDHTEICAALSNRFGANFKLEITGTCATLTAELEGDPRLVITDCEGPLSPVGWHLDGRAAGFYVGVHATDPDTEAGAEVDVHRAYAYSEMAPPTVAAVGDLVQETLERAVPGRSTPFGQQTR
jgi:hypothetical protein